MTTMEGENIISFLKEKDRFSSFAAELEKDKKQAQTPDMTTNQFAVACLNHQEIGEEKQIGWNFEKCIFLMDDACSIYPVRPFGCRSFGSFEDCSVTGEAEVPEMYLAVNTVLMQIIEHLDEDGGLWGRYDFGAEIPGLAGNR